MVRRIVWTEDFKGQVKRLARKYRLIHRDLEEFHHALAGGSLPGDRMTGVRALPVKEARMRNRSAGAGKSGGFRIAYFYDSATIYLLMIVQRSARIQVSGERILALLEKEGLA